MLSQELLNEIISSQNVYDRRNIYENNRKKDYIEIKKVLEEHLKNSINNLGKKNIGFVM